MGGWTSAPKTAGSDANYYNRAYWKLHKQQTNDKNLELRLFIVLAYPVTHISKIVVSFNLSGLIFEQRWSHEAERGG